MLITFAPVEDRTRHPANAKPTLSNIAIKVGLYRKAVKVCYIPNTTTFLDLSPNLSLSFNEPIPDMNVLRAHRKGLCWAPDVTGEKVLSTFAPAEDWTCDPLYAKPTFYHVAIKTGLHQQGLYLLTREITIAWYYICSDKSFWPCKCKKKKKKINSALVPIQQPSSKTQIRLHGCHFIGFALSLTFLLNVAVNNTSVMLSCL